MFVKHYAPNHMPDPKGEWSLKDNNSELHDRICSKVNQFIYTLVCNYISNIRILAKAFFRYFVHKVVPIQNACVWKRRVTQTKIYRICSKVNLFIYTLVCNYMPNIRILAKAFFRYFCSQGCSYTKCLWPKKGSNSTKIYRIGSKVDQFIYTLVCIYMPNISVLAKAVFQIFRSQGCS